jgi:hypothetical protein
MSVTAIDPRDDHSPVSSQKQEVALIMQGNDLPALEFGHGRKQSLEHPTNGVA